MTLCPRPVDPGRVAAAVCQVPAAVDGYGEWERRCKDSQAEMARREGLRRELAGFKTEQEQAAKLRQRIEEIAKEVGAAGESTKLYNAAISDPAYLELKQSGDALKALAAKAASGEVAKMPFGDRLKWLVEYEAAQRKHTALLDEKGPVLQRLAEAAKAKGAAK